MDTILKGVELMIQEGKLVDCGYAIAPVIDWGNGQSYEENVLSKGYVYRWVIWGGRILQLQLDFGGWPKQDVF